MLALLVTGSCTFVCIASLLPGRCRAEASFFPLSLEEAEFFSWKLQNTITKELPLPALNKDNYSGNILANQARPCISPAREATSQDLANISGA
ncbi:hypothetical protein CRENBAI_023542 [Crenichthys baileyi]|uniref:Uncharacterized protein n=1 Tax=Crenichthys baileyi TaxID=28760 RepID=A0AAV9RCS2_9TELE